MNNAVHTPRQGGVIREILKTPFLKDILRNNVTALKSGSGSTMVRTVMRQDPEVFLTLAVSAPSLVNIIIRAFAELGQQLKTQYPPDILAPFMESIFKEIDTDAINQCGAVWKELIGALLKSSPEVMGKLAEAALTSGPAAAAQTIDMISRTLNSLEKDRPGAVGGFITDMLSRVDRPGASGAARIVAEAVLDQKWHVCSWLYGLARHRIKKRFAHQRSK